MEISLRDSIKKYLLENPVDRSTSNPYGKAAKKFDVDTEVIRRVWRTLRDSGLVEISKKGVKFAVDGDTAHLTQLVNERIVTLEDLIRVCNIDTDEWKIDRWECNKWEVGAKNDVGIVNITPLFQVKAKLEKRKIDTDLEKQKDLIIKEMKTFSPKVSPIKYSTESKHTNNLLEISLFDMHFGKLANKNETGEDYDLKIAEKRFKAALDELLERSKNYQISRILFPVGNDLIHVDNINSTTYNGTPQDSDTRFHKIITTVKRVLIEAVDKLTNLAPVDLVIVPGNHDTTASFLIGEILEAWYHNNPNVTVDNSPRLRKYYKFGKNAFQFTHGDREKHSDLGLIFASEAPKMWASSKFRFTQVGHFHKGKKTSYITFDTYQGFQIQILPSLSANDAWHAGKGYHSPKQAKSFIFNFQDGLVAEYTYTI